ncbi:hypothetical protein [Emticicia aquatilis]|nr:hypothetical protein [Emticicia aquatilis]
MTRRVVKLPSWSTMDFNDLNISEEYIAVIAHETGCEVELESPYGKVGDELWVRETFFKNGNEYIFLADGTCCEQFEQCECSEVGKPKWKPSIFMPREASRITLEITNIKVEKLQDISEQDAKNEGIETKTYGDHPHFCTIDYLGAQIYSKSKHKHIRGFKPGFCADTGRQFRDSFRTLWSSINGTSSWDNNPYVWVVEFKKKEVSSE